MFHENKSLQCSTACIDLLSMPLRPDLHPNSNINTSLFSRASKILNFYIYNINRADVKKDKKFMYSSQNVSEFYLYVDPGSPDIDFLDLHIMRQ
jgi:hypothetical protein